jgi:NADPH2:quinone reductase
VVHETGPASALKIEKAWPVPTIADGQVLVKNEYAGINFIDTYHRSGLYKRDLPFIGGQEGGGKIAAVTPKVCRCKVNVWVCTRAGTHKRSVQPWRMLPPG